MRKTLLIILSVFCLLPVLAQKQVYIPTFITNENMDLNDPNSQWCYCRSMETENIVVFWEPGFGDNPSTATGDYYVDMDALLEVAEKSYHIFKDSLLFASPNNSITDDYKLMIFILHSTEWAAYGSGQDDKVGTLHVNPAAANINSVLAHEIGHCFQYIAGIDGVDGYRYGYGANASGGNGFWEQSANWMAFKVYPEQQFSTHDFNGYIAKNHKHIIHEEPRYQNYFIQDYWSYKNGTDFIGRMWRESTRPEDPVETYKRLTGVSQTQFNNQMYEHAALLTTWDIPSIREYGKNYINRRAQVSMTETTENYWRVDSSVCIENYGYNSIQLNAPSEAREVNVTFRGLAGENGYRSLNVNQGGWRYGFVALLEDGTRVYSDMGTAKIENGNNPEETLTFQCPDNCVNLWLVVSGSPQEHWRHAWDDDDTNDEQWPYEVQFQNTDLLGVFNNPIHDETITYNLTLEPASDYTPTSVDLNASRIGEAFAMSPTEIAAALGSSITYYGVNPNGSTNATSTANAPGHWYGNNGQIVNWGAEAYVFSELNINNMIANVGQYPDRAQAGDQFTIKQQLVYQKSPSESATVTLIFNIEIKDVVTGVFSEEGKTGVYPNPTTTQVNWQGEKEWQLYNQVGVLEGSGSGESVNMEYFPSGVHFLVLEGERHKLVKE